MVLSEEPCLRHVDEVGHLAPKRMPHRALGNVVCVLYGNLLKTKTNGKRQQRQHSDKGGRLEHHELRLGFRESVE